MARARAPQRACARRGLAPLLLLQPLARVLKDGDGGGDVHVQGADEPQLGYLHCMVQRAQNLGGDALPLTPQHQHRLWRERKVLRTRRGRCVVLLLQEGASTRQLRTPPAGLPHSGAGLAQNFPQHQQPAATSAPQQAHLQPRRLCSLLQAHQAVAAGGLPLEPR